MRGSKTCRIARKKKRIINNHDMFTHTKQGLGRLYTSSQKQTNKGRQDETCSVVARSALSVRRYRSASVFLSCSISRFAAGPLYPKKGYHAKNVHDQDKVFKNKNKKIMKKDDTKPRVWGHRIFRSQFGCNTSSAGSRLAVVRKMKIVIRNKKEGICLLFFSSNVPKDLEGFLGEGRLRIRP